jgi:hypothetical protein
MYKLQKLTARQIDMGLTESIMVLRVLDNTFIPFAPDNTDYQAYLKWLEDGGVPLPADE